MSAPDAGWSFSGRPARLGVAGFSSVLRVGFRIALLGYFLFRGCLFCWGFFLGRLRLCVRILVFIRLAVVLGASGFDPDQRLDGVLALRAYPGRGFHDVPGHVPGRSDQQGQFSIVLRRGPGGGQVPRDRPLSEGSRGPFNLGARPDAVDGVAYMASELCGSGRSDLPCFVTETAPRAVYSALVPCGHEQVGAGNVVSRQFLHLFQR